MYAPNRGRRDADQLTLALISPSVLSTTASQVLRLDSALDVRVTVALPIADPDARAVRRQAPGAANDIRAAKGDKDGGERGHAVGKFEPVGGVEAAQPMAG